MVTQEKETDETSIQPTSKTDFFITILFSSILTLGFIGFAFYVSTVFFQFLMMALVPSPWDYLGKDPAKVAWIETLKVFFFIGLIIMIILVVLGLFIKRFKLSFVSSVTLLLPIFGYLSISMTWLSGLSALLMLWLPIAENYPEILHLGDCVFFPVYMTIYGGWQFLFPVLIMLIGIFLFFLGVLSWIRGESSKYEYVSFLIYRYSRHPQYLGYSMATYGMLILIGFRPGLENWFSVPTLFWLLSTICIIGVAIHEENTLLAMDNPDYRKWRDHTAFMIPFPRFISNLFLIPLKVILKKSWPENDREIVIAQSIYFVLFSILSIPIVVLFCPYPPLF